MGIRLDHLIVPSRDRRAAAARLAGILGVPWSEQASGGPFSAVYVNSELTLDLAQFSDEVPPQHYCFHVDEAQFDAILGRLREQDIASAARRWAQWTCRSRRMTADGCCTGASLTDMRGKY